MSELENKIKKYADNYYRGNELISDAEYDALIEELRKENPKSELLSENQGIAGSDLKGISKKYKLDITMGSLAKCNSDEQFKTWWEKHPNDDLVSEAKIDGNSQVLHYEKGHFQYSRSRGDGEYGEDTTQKLLAIGIPKTLKEEFTGNIRGEVVMLRSTFKKYFSDQKNPRNTAAGIMGRLGTKDCEKLNFIAYDVFDDNNIFDTTEIDKLKFLTENNFLIPENKHNISYDEIIAWKNSLDTTSGEIPVDGIVIKQNKVDKNDLKRITPLNNVALKPELQIAVSEVVDIDWTLAGRYLAPTAVIEPVELEGTTVSRASLSNVNIMKKLGVYIGAKVFVKKAGLIIPQITKVENPNYNWIEKHLPENCPACGEKLIVNSSGIVECINEKCQRKTSYQIKKFFKIFGIKGVGSVFVENLEKENKDIYWLLDACLKNDSKILNSYCGGINGEKIYKQVKDVLANNISPAQFLAIFDVKLFDQKRIELLGNKSLDELLKLTKNEVLNTNGFSEITATAFINFMDNYKNEIEKLRKYFIIETEKKEKTKMGITVVFTGACPGMTRNQLSEKASEKGYIVQSAVNAKTQLLVCADPNSGSSKLQKAQKNGTKIISYDDFLKELGE